MTKRRFAVNFVSGLALVGAVALVYGFALRPGAATPVATRFVALHCNNRHHVVRDSVVSTNQPAGGSLLLAGFAARSYAPGDVAALKIDGGSARRVTLQFFLAGAYGARVSGLGCGARDLNMFGQAAGKASVLRRPATGAWVAHLRLGAKWPSGDYVARLTWKGGIDYAPFILHPKRLGTAPVLVIEPTNTWHAYNSLDGDSWYMNSNVHVIDLSHPFSATDIKGRPHLPGLPKPFQRGDVGFLRWYWSSGYKADFFSDDDLEAIKNVKQLLRYKLIVFGGHEEYVTPHVYKLIAQYRDAGRNLAFLSANNFFYRVTVHGNTMVGRKTWRKLGAPEASLVGAQYVGWNDAHWPNQPYQIVNTKAAPWLFEGTGLRDGMSFGAYGIEIDEPNDASPPGTQVIARIPKAFGPKDADMTIYRKGNSTVFDAGVLNFAASAHWPKVERLVSNLWGHLSGESPGA